MLDYYSTQLLQHILVSYLPRIHLAEDVYKRQSRRWPQKHPLLSNSRLEQLH